MSTDKPRRPEEDFAAMLRRHRTAAGLTQRELAEKAGLGERTISDWERGLKLPHRENLRMVTKALNLSPADAAEFQAVATAAPSPPAESLPEPRTSLIGRERDIQKAARMLKSGETRLLTLIGPGGVGKTRIALHVAAELKEPYRDGAAFVSLAPIVDPDLAPGAVIRALGIANTAGRPVTDALHAWLRARKMLLVLDNCEQAPFGPFVAALLSSSPGLVVLATSRAPLHVSGEQQMEVAPLGLVDPAHLPPLPELAQVAAVELFVARARAVRPDFTLTPANAAAVAEICARLDGLPLAIELAAARTKMLTPAALASLLHERLRVLTDGPLDAPARHQTMRATIAWSEELLDEAERAAFRRLSVFSGGCTLEDAAAVIGEGDPFATLAYLTALVDQSLVRRDEDRRGESRFVMLETIREFASEQLVHHGEDAETRVRHASAYFALTERAEPLLVGADSVAWLDRLESEHDNLWAALNWFLDRHEAEPALRLTSSLWRWWWLRGRLREGRDWLMRALAGDGNASPETLSNALNVLGNINSDLGSYHDAQADYEESLALRRQIGEPFPIAASLHNLGVITGYLGNFEKARLLVEESLELTSDKSSGTIRLARSLQTLGDLAYCDGNIEHSRKLLERVFEIVGQLGDQSSAAYASYFLGRTVSHLDIDQGTSLLQSSLEAFQIEGDKLGTAFSMIELGRIALDGKDTHAAELFYREGLALCQEVGSSHGVLMSIEGSAMLAANRNEWRCAARLLGGATRGRAELARPLAASEQTRLSVLERLTLSMLGNDLGIKLMSEGASTRIDDHVADLLARQ